MRPVEKESKGKNKATPLGAFTPLVRRWLPELCCPLFKIMTVLAVEKYNFGGIF